MSVVTGERRPVRFSAFAAIVVLYCVAPGHRDLLGGLPLGPAATAIAAAAIVLGTVLRRASFDRRTFAAFAVAAGLLVAARVTLGVLSPPTGWTARYYANDHWAGRPERSSDFRIAGATRIDRRIAFEAETFPAHYLHDPEFNRGDRREVSEPMSVEWEGFAFLDAPSVTGVALTTRGQATVSVDGEMLVRASSDRDATQTRDAKTLLAAGSHDIVIRYMKPANVTGLIDVRAESELDRRPAELLVTSIPGTPLGDRMRQVGRIGDVLVLSLFALVTLGAARQRLRRGAASAEWVALGLFAVLGVQGWVSASRFAGRMISLNALDDWFAYESRARQVLIHGWSMTFGEPIGEGAPYSFTRSTATFSPRCTSSPERRCSGPSSSSS